MVKRGILFSNESGDYLVTSCTECGSVLEAQFRTLSGTAVPGIVKSMPTVSSRNLELSASIKLQEGLQLGRGWDLLDEI